MMVRLSHGTFTHYFLETQPLLDLGTSDVTKSSDQIKIRGSLYRSYESSGY